MGKWLVALVLLAGCSSTAGKTGGADNPPAADVTLTSCAKTVISSVDVKVTIVNHSSKRSNYVIEISLIDGSGVKVGDGFASSNNVEAGQTATETGFASLTGSPATFTCKIASVSRYAS